jgi:hypothetical protein
VKKRLFLLILGLFLAVSARAQGDSTVARPDCYFSTTFTAAGRSVFDNRGLTIPVCTTWHLTYYAEGFAAVSIELDEAPSSGDSPGTWVTWPNLSSGALPLTSTTSGQITGFKYFPWVSILVNSVTGTGKIRAEAYGYRPGGSSDSSTGSVTTSSGGAPAATVTCTTAASACQVQGAAAADSAAAGNPVLVAGVDAAGNVQELPVSDQSTTTVGLPGVMIGVNRPDINTFVRLAAGAGGSLSQGTFVASPDGTTSVQIASDDQAVIRLPGFASFGFNGATWDRQFYCPITKFVTGVTATTSQIVAGVAGQKIRVCSVVIERNDTTGVATTLKLVEGTGTNCGTGQTALTANLFSSGATAVTTDSPPAVINNSASGPFITNTAADALCVQTTGAASSFDVTITEAQY